MNGITGHRYTNHPTSSSASAINNQYSVKYLGIVDGAMGILSRKMALQGSGKDPIAASTKVVQMNQALRASHDSRDQATANFNADFNIKSYGHVRPVLGDKYSGYRREDEPIEQMDDSFIKISRRDKTMEPA